MTCTEGYKEHIEYTFHAFCKIVIRNASYTAIRLSSMMNCLPPPSPVCLFWNGKWSTCLFFKRIPQHEIGRRYGYCRSSTGYHIRKALRQLYEEMEGMNHEE